MSCFTATFAASASDDDADAVVDDDELGLQKNDVMLPLVVSCFLLVALPLLDFFAAAFDISVLFVSTTMS